jgi:uncharacterized damage-inducible protein DinB
MTSFTAELEQEAKITSRVLARIPEDKLAWKPHSKSMTLGQLGLHTAMIPGVISRITTPDTFQVDPSTFGNARQPANLAEIMKEFDDSLAAARIYLDGLNAEKSESVWRVQAGDQEVVAMPRKWALRSIMFNHLYHHRGQLSVYLRLLDIPVPVIYGASADESPFR